MSLQPERVRTAHEEWCLASRGLRWHVCHFLTLLYCLQNRSEIGGKHMPCNSPLLEPETQRPVT